jgi:hypothetical protein
MRSRSVDGLQIGRFPPPPNRPLQQPNAATPRSKVNPCRDAAGVSPAAPRGRATLARDLGVRC